MKRTVSILHAARALPLALICAAIVLVAVERSFCGEVRVLNQLVESARAVDSDYRQRVAVLEAEGSTLQSYLSDLRLRYTQECDARKLDVDAELKVRCRDLQDDGRSTASEIVSISSRILIQYSQWSASKARAFREVANALAQMRIAELPREVSLKGFEDTVPVAQDRVDAVLGDDPGYAAFRAGTTQVQGRLEELQRQLNATLASVGASSAADVRQNFAVAAWVEGVLVGAYKSYGQAYEAMAKLVRIGGLQPSGGPALPVAVVPPGADNEDRSAPTPVAAPARPSVKTWRR